MITLNTYEVLVILHHVSKEKTEKFDPTMLEIISLGEEKEVDLPAKFLWCIVREIPVDGESAEKYYRLKVKCAEEILRKEFPSQRPLFHEEQAQVTVMLSSMGDRPTVSETKLKKLISDEIVEQLADIFGVKSAENPIVLPHLEEADVSKPRSANKRARRKTKGAANKTKPKSGSKAES